MTSSTATHCQYFFQERGTERYGRVADTPSYSGGPFLRPDSIKDRKFLDLLMDFYFEDVFWDIALRSLVKVNDLFRGAFCLHREGDRSADGDSTHL